MKYPIATASSAFPISFLAPRSIAGDRTPENRARYPIDNEGKVPASSVVSGSIR